MRGLSSRTQPYLDWKIREAIASSVAAAWLSWNSATIAALTFVALGLLSINQRSAAQLLSKNARESKHDRARLALLASTSPWSSEIGSRTLSGMSELPGALGIYASNATGFVASIMLFTQLLVFPWSDTLLFPLLAYWLLWWKYGSEHLVQDHSDLPQLTQEDIDLARTGSNAPDKPNQATDSSHEPDKSMP